MSKALSTTGLSHLFIPICKIDEEQRLVYGKMTFEGLDSAKEIWDYEGSKPYFEAWSSNAEKSSGGKSLGNLRSMHQPIAAGKLTQFVLDDEGKSVHICGKVVDDGEWSKVLEGVYTGFSQGGRYVKRWKDPDDPSKTRYISDPVEVSLVDLPCLPGAEFEYVKADGTVEVRKFNTTKETTMYEPTNEEVAARATKIAADEGGTWTDHIEKAATDLRAEHATGAEAPAAVASTTIEATVEDAAKAAAAGVAEETKPKEQDDDEDEDEDEDKKKEKSKKAARDSLVQVWLTPDGQKFSKAADAVSHITGETDAPPLTPVQAALKAAQDAAGGEAPVVVLVKFTPEAQLPVAKAALEALAEKGLWTASRALDVLESVISIQCSAAWEAEYEEDGSTVPSQLAAAATSLGAATLALCQEEIAEALSHMVSDDPNADVVVDIIEAGATAEFVKGILGNGELMKAGARNARADASRIQKIHDSSVELGADCGDAEKLAKMAESNPVIKGLLDQNDSLQGQVTEAIDGIGELTKTITTMRGEMTALRNTPAPMAPRTSVVGKTQDGDPDGAGVVDKAAAETMISDMMKTESGRAMMADAAIRAAQENGFTR